MWTLANNCVHLCAHGLSDSFKGVVLLCAYTVCAALCMPVTGQGWHALLSSVFQSESFRYCQCEVQPGLHIQCCLTPVSSLAAYWSSLLVPDPGGYSHPQELQGRLFVSRACQLLMSMPCCVLGPQPANWAVALPVWLPAITGQALAMLYCNLVTMALQTTVASNPHNISHCLAWLISSRQQHDKLRHKMCSIQTFSCRTTCRTPNKALQGVETARPGWWEYSLL